MAAICKRDWLMAKRELTNRQPFCPFPLPNRCDNKPIAITTTRIPHNTQMKPVRERERIQFFEWKENNWQRFDWKWLRAPVNWWSLTCQSNQRAVLFNPAKTNWNWGINDNLKRLESVASRCQPRSKMADFSKSQSKHRPGQIHLRCYYRTSRRTRRRKRRRRRRTIKRRRRKVVILNWIEEPLSEASW